MVLPFASSQSAVHGIVAYLESTEAAAVLWHEYKGNLDALLVRAGVDDMECHCMHSEF